VTEKLTSRQLPETTSQVDFGLGWQWFVSGRNRRRAMVEISTSAVEILMHLVKIWPDLHLEKEVGQSGRLDSIFHVKTHQPTRGFDF